MKLTATTSGTHISGQVEGDLDATNIELDHRGRIACRPPAIVIEAACGSRLTVRVHSWAIASRIEAAYREAEALR